MNKNRDVPLVGVILISIFISISLIAFSSLIALLLIPNFTYVSDGRCDISGEPAQYLLTDYKTNKPLGEFSFFYTVLYYLRLQVFRGNLDVSAPFEIRIFVYLHFILGFFITRILINLNSIKNRLLEIPLDIIKIIILIFGALGVQVGFQLGFIDPLIDNWIFSNALMLVYFIGGLFYFSEFYLTPKEDEIESSSEIKSKEFIDDGIGYNQCPICKKKKSPNKICCRFLFNWDEVPGNDNEKLIEFLIEKFDIEWIRGAVIEKIYDDKVIRITNNDNNKSLLLSLNNKKNKMNLRIDGNLTYEFIVKIRNGKLNIYTH